MGKRPTAETLHVGRALHTLQSTSRSRRLLSPMRQLKFALHRQSPVLATWILKAILNLHSH